MSAALWYRSIDAAGSARVGPKTSPVQVEGYAVIPTRPAALALAAGLSEDVYSLARELASENPRDSAATQLLIAEATRNKARERGWSVTRLLTHSRIPSVAGLYSEQSAGPKWASTLRDPTRRHVMAARIALEERSDLFRGAVDFFDPSAQDGRKQNGRQLRLTSEEYIAERAADGLAWIGPVDGVDAYKLMAFARRGRNPDTAPALAVLAAGRKQAKIVLGVAGGAGALLLAGAILWAAA